MLLFISFLLIIFSLLLIFHNYGSNKNTCFLAITFLLIAIYGITHYLTVYGESVFWLAIFYNNISPFMLLIGPFLYFYIRGTLDDREGLKKKDSLHFIPAIIHFIGVIPYYLTSFSYKESMCRLLITNLTNVKKIEWNIFFDTKFNFIFRVFLLFIYAIYCAILLWKFSNNSKRKENIPHKQYSITIRWLTILLILLFFLVVNFFAITFYFFEFNEFNFKQSIINSFTLVGFGLMVISLLFFPEVLYGMPRHKKVKNKKSVYKPSKIPELKEQIESMEEDPFLDLYEKIKIYLEREKHYLNPNFSIAQISLDLGVPQNHISYCINTFFKTKFSKLKTKLRVEHTKILLQESLHTNITIDGIAQLSGFSSRSSFYFAFKEETNITPSEYLKTIEEK